MLRRSGMLRTTLDRWGFQKLIERFHSTINGDEKNVAFKICDGDCLDGGGLVCLSFLLHLKVHSFREKKIDATRISPRLYICLYKYSNYIIHLVLQFKKKAKNHMLTTWHDVYTRCAGGNVFGRLEFGSHCPGTQLCAVRVRVISMSL